jgi:mRNA interferase RelE/StbE
VIKPSKNRYWYNGVESGEVAQCAAIAGHYGVPTMQPLRSCIRQNAGFPRVPEFWRIQLPARSHGHTRFVSHIDRPIASGYNLARMRYDILFAPEAVEDFESLAAKVRAEVRDCIERHLRNEPTRTSKSRIKRLRGLSRPQYRLRVGDDIRVFYDVTEHAVEILGIVPKSAALQWLERYGENDERSGAV